MITSSVLCLWRLVFGFICAPRRFIYGQRPAMKRHQYVMIALILILLIYYAFHKHIWGQHHYIKLLPVTKRNLQDYCNFPINTNGAEGSIPGGAQDFKLEMVQLMIRHGDRSPLIKFDGVETHDFDCSLSTKDKTLKELFTGYKEAVKNSHISWKKMTSRALYHNLVPQMDVCEYGGQMTRKGFRQHLELGRFLHKAYSNLNVTSNSVYARSTNYDRTLQSVASLLHGFLGNNVIKKGNIVIKVSTDTFFREDENGFLKPCPAFTKPVDESRRSEEYKAGAAKMEPFMKEIANLIVQPRQSLPPVSFLADICLVHFCQGLKYPCADEGCFSESMVFKLIAYADWSFTHNYSQVADVLALPVLSQIATRMIDKTHSGSPITFALYGGHETSVIPLLVSLGIFEQRWIPYASRLVFELWTKTSETTTKSRQFKRKYIRVLFNGKVVTGRLKFCLKNLIQSDELCPLDDFLGWLGGGRFEDTPKRYEELCFK